MLIIHYISYSYVVKQGTRFYVLKANMKLKTVFVQNLKKYRKDRGISQMILAERCDTSTSYIGQIEIGNRFPSVDLIEKIAVALQIKPYLLFIDEPGSDKPAHPLPAKKDLFPDYLKDELIESLNTAIRRVVKRTKA